MLSGCEAINLGDYKSPDSKYAQGVLKLHANDLGVFAGQEGFLDMVKKGAGKIKEWFLNLIKAIVNFIDDITGQTAKRKQIEKELEERDRQIKNDLDARKAHDDKLTKAASECFSFPAEETQRIYEELNGAGYFDQPLFDKLTVSTFRIDGGHGAMRELAMLAREPDNKTHLYVAKELETLEKGIAELALESKRAVNKYDDSETNAKMESQIRVAGKMLTKFTRVLKIWDDALNRFYKMVEPSNKD